MSPEGHGLVSDIHVVSNVGQALPVCPIIGRITKSMAPAQKRMRQTPPIHHRRLRRFDFVCVLTPVRVGCSFPTLPLSKFVEYLASGFAGHGS